MTKKPEHCKLYQEQILETDKSLNAFGVCPKCLWDVADHDHQPAGGSKGSDYYHARMIIERSKKKSGVRNQAYLLASQNVAYYFWDKKHSIYYDQANLEISLLFKGMDSAHRFVNEMIGYVQYSGLSRTYVEDYPIVHPTFPLKLVYKDHYDPTEYPDSARSTVLTVLPTMMRSSLTDDEYLMALEKRDHSDFRGLNAFKCHLIGQAVDEDYVDSANNIFYMSWTMHQRFDGLNSETKQVPLIAIRFAGVGEEKVTIHGYERQKANLVIECVDFDAYDTTLERLKDAYSPNIDELEITTFVYPEDMEEFIYCITYKYEETKAMWNRAKPGELVDDTTAGKLRTDASKWARAKQQERASLRNKKEEEF